MRNKINTLLERPLGATIILVAPTLLYGGVILFYLRILIPSLKIISTTSIIEEHYLTYYKEFSTISYLYCILMICITLYLIINGLRSDSKIIYVPLNECDTIQWYRLPNKLKKELENLWKEGESQKGYVGIYYASTIFWLSTNNMLSKTPNHYQIYNFITSKFNVKFTRSELNNKFDELYDIFINKQSTLSETNQLKRQETYKLIKSRLDKTISSPLMAI